MNQPRLPCTHRAASSAPRAKCSRSRAVCVSVIVSAAAVEADRVRARDRPGARRRDVDRRSVARLRASSAAARAPCPTARPASPRDAARAARRRTRLRRDISLGGPRDDRVRTGSRRSRSSARRRRRSPARSAIAARAPPRARCQPVVPITTFDARAGERAGSSPATASGDREIDRDVGVRPRRRCAGVRRRSTTPATVEPVLGRQRLDEPSHPSVADQQHAAARRRGSGHRPAPRRLAASNAASCRRVIAVATSRRCSTKVMFRRDAACDTIRSGTPSSAASEPRSPAADRVRQAVADGAEDRHVALDRHVRELLERRDDRRQAGGRRRPSPTR